MRKLKDGEESTMKLRGIMQIYKISLTEIKLFGKENSNSLNSKEIMLRRILKKLRGNFNRL
jgi:hypothetical protein